MVVDDSVMSGATVLDVEVVRANLNTCPPRVIASTPAISLLGARPEGAAGLGNRVAAWVIAHPGAIIPADATADLAVPDRDLVGPKVTMLDRPEVVC